MMKIEINKENDKEMSFELKESNPAFANSLRRAMRSVVPVMAIDHVIFEKNNSGLYDEILAHRMGMIPLKFDRKLYNLLADCSCKGKGCSNCQCVFVIDKKGPCIVKTSDMKGTDKNVKPVDGNIPIVELLENQSIKLEAVATLGVGTKHAKYQAANVGYKYASAKDHDDDFSRLAKSIVAAPEENFIFKVETVSGLTPREILISALGVLKEDAKEFIKGLNKNVK